jgi:hypothetical protein
MTVVYRRAELHRKTRRVLDVIVRECLRATGFTEAMMPRAFEDTWKMIEAGELFFERAPLADGSPGYRLGSIHAVGRRPA